MRSVNQSASLPAAYTYDNEGRTLTVTYPYNPATQSSPEYNYGFDSMGRLNTMSTGSDTLVTGVTYNLSNQILSIAGALMETRSYNVNGQLTNLTSGSSYHYAYNYSATQNNGRITSMEDVGVAKPSPINTIR